MATTAAAKGDASARIDALHWDELSLNLHARGFATTGTLLTPSECGELVEVYARDQGFRKRVVMARHGYGKGEYKYFDYPLPPLIAELRRSIYARLAPIANRWAELLKQEIRYPLSHAEMLQRCHAAGQERATPLLLKYEAGDYNCLHQDVYGEHLFPLQIVVLLSRPGVDFEGGEFLLTEQRPRMQSRGEVVPLSQGEAAVFAVRHRPAQGSRGFHRVQMRHGVSRVRSGNRYTLGLIFHDAK